MPPALPLVRWWPPTAAALPLLLTTLITLPLVVLTRLPFSDIVSQLSTTALLPLRPLEDATTAPLLLLKRLLPATTPPPLPFSLAFNGGRSWVSAMCGR